MNKTCFSHLHTKHRNGCHSPLAIQKMRVRETSPVFASQMLEEACKLSTEREKWTLALARLAAKRVP